MTYRFPIHVGDRVAIAPHHDLWMAGCRFGTVLAGWQGGVFYLVRLDTGREVTLSKSDLLGAVGEHKAPESATPSTVTCQHCQRVIVQDPEGRWIDPEAGYDDEFGDGVWRETCDQHDTFTAEHEPVTEGATPSTGCPEFDEDGSCIHSDHMGQAGL